MQEDNASIPYVNLSAQWDEDKEELLPILEKVMTEAHHVGGAHIEKFEQHVAQLCDVKHAIALNSGTDALVLGMVALGIKAGDEVITPPNSFVASTAAIVQLGAKPVFVDVLPDQNIDPDLVEQMITEKTKAIMPVHLTGRIANMDPILAIASKYDLKIVEDAAQSIGSKYRGQLSGSLGHVGCFSAHPLKNLNACGDAGFLTTDDDQVAESVRLMRNHGLADRNTVTSFGCVSRMDNLQAAILDFRLQKLDQIIQKRRKNAQVYTDLIDSRFVFVPEEKSYEFNTYHTFVIQTNCRNELQKFLNQHQVGSAIHYPIPIHLQPASASLGYKSGDFPEAERQAGKILSLPIHQYLDTVSIERISKLINQFLSTHEI